MMFWLEHQTANCPCSIHLQDLCHLRISLDSSIKSEKRELVLLAKARTAGKEEKIFITLSWKNKLTEVALRYQNVENIFRILKDNYMSNFDSNIFSRYWDNRALGEDDDSAEMIHPGFFCLLG